MAYGRRPGMQRTDLAIGREHEARVRSWLPELIIDQSKTNDKLDFWLPGAVVEVKAKNQPISSRWPVVGTRGDAFILDELSVRKGMEHFPHCYFVLIDAPLERVFLARIDEIVCGDHVRLDRVSNSGNPKGKWVLDLAQFRQIPTEPAPDIAALIFADQVATPWKQSGCVIPAPEV